MRIIAQLSDASGAFLVQPVHDEAHGGHGLPSRCNRRAADEVRRPEIGRSDWEI